MKIKIPAYAKINLGLKIFGKNKNNIHDIYTITQSVSLCDFVSVSLNNTGEIKISSNADLCPENENTAFSATEYFFKIAGLKNPGVYIEIEKNIPWQAGLGGGSADAAATLFILNKIFYNPLNNKELLNISSKIGADVPICFTGGTLCCNKGCICRISGFPNCCIAVIKPNKNISTTKAYNMFDKISKEKNSGPDPRIEKLRKSIFASDIDNIYRNAFNDFEKVVKPVNNFKLTGSGSACYKIFKNESEALREIKKIYNSDFINSFDIKNNSGIFICRPVSDGAGTTENFGN
jgi:4-diphosphocytidyl-2-C-methyl-D-erythritol kinase